MFTTFFFAIAQTLFNILKNGFCLVIQKNLEQTLKNILTTIKVKINKYQIFQWFDVLNSTSKNNKTKVGCGFGVEEELQEGVLHRMEMFIKNIYWPKKGKPLPFELGIVCAIKSLRCLLEEFRAEGYQYILTARLNQVPIFH